MPGVWPLPMMERMQYPPLIRRIQWEDEPSIADSWPQWMRTMTVSFGHRVANRVGDEEVRAPFNVIYSHEVELANPAVEHS